MSPKAEKSNLSSMQADHSPSGSTPQSKSMQPARLRTSKIYVKVEADFDLTGYMRPKTITWADGRVFHIDELQDYRPASAEGFDLPGDCYTVKIGETVKHLFFEQSHFGHCTYGRWFVEVTEPDDE